MELNAEEVQADLKDSTISDIKIEYSFEQESELDKVKNQFSDTKDSFSQVGDAFKESKQEWKGYVSDVKDSFRKWTEEGLLNDDDKSKLKDTLMDGVKGLFNKLMSPVAFLFGEGSIKENLLKWALEEEYFLHEEYISTSFGVEEMRHAVSRPLVFKNPFKDEDKKEDKFGDRTYQFKNGKRGKIGDPTQKAYSDKENLENKEFKDKAGPSIFGDDNPKVPLATAQETLNKEADSIVNASLFNVDQSKRFTGSSQGIWDKVLTSVQELFQLVDFSKPYLVRDIYIESSKKGVFKDALSKVEPNNTGKIFLDGRLDSGLQLNGIKVNTMSADWQDTTNSVMIKNVASHNQTQEANKVSFSFRDSFKLEIYRILAQCLEQTPIKQKEAQVNLTFSILVPIGRLENDKSKRTFAVSLKDCYVVELDSLSIDQNSISPLKIKTSLIYGSIEVKVTTSTAASSTATSTEASSTEATS